MIAPLNGEVCFSDGLVIRARMPVWELPLQPEFLSRLHTGWVLFSAGRHHSEHGEFEMELACSTDHALAIFLVVLWSVDELFGVPSPKDRERTVFHESLLARDLHGQREFSWGEAFCKYNPADSRNCLNVVYTAGPKVPDAPPPVTRVLWERSAPEKIHERFIKASPSSAKMPVHEAHSLGGGYPDRDADSGIGRARRAGHPRRVFSE